MGKLKCKRYWPMSKDEKMSFAGMQISLVSNIYHIIILTVCLLHLVQIMKYTVAIFFC